MTYSLLLFYWASLSNNAKHSLFSLNANFVFVCVFGSSLCLFCCPVGMVGQAPKIYQNVWSCCYSWMSRQRSCVTSF